LHAIIAEAGKRRAIPPEMAVRIIADAASGLHAAHELKDANGALRGVVHRDISPHNILLGTNGAVKLVDFGVAKALGRVSDMTRAGQLKGKFGYMSPEQALGRPVDRRSDVFALGIVLFELTTSRRLFRGESDVETLRYVTTGDVPRPSSIDPDYPPELESIVLRALQRDPARRYQTAAGLESDLNAFLKARHTVVPQSGVAALLKRVVGPRIEQRRRAVRAVLKTLAREDAPVAELLSADPAFTPTGRHPGDHTPSASRSGPSVPAFATPPGRAVAAERRAPRRSRRRQSFGWVSALGYAIGVAGIAIALIVLLLLQR
jgi:serine/threonine-protein kinase